MVTATSDHSVLPYRQGVGLCLFNREGLVLVAERRDRPGAWQMPQGGVQKGEDLVVAALRELKEEVGTDNAEMLPQLGQIPAISAKDADPHARLNDGVDLACNREDQRGFAASVGAEDGNMLSGTKIEVHIMQNDPVAPGNVDVFEFEKLFGIDRDCNIVRIL